MGSRASADERRGRTQELIERLIDERRRLLVLYERVAGVTPYEDEPPTPELLAEFFQILVDYIAAGHFGLYERIAKGEERRRAVVGLARDIYPRIAATTDAAMQANDAYERAGRRGLTVKLARMLWAMGEQLALRIDLEDRLIAAMVGRPEEQRVAD
ncbi:MAG: Rsd/AlgQ family anti-sigma factor [Ectothiorhodospiraceae bacterium]|nr:Rsd/AlgQ family anti-sigma factor [Chromatiales bacterium]MCP5156030.1 Rsd/AlgQ family anti-sigma factor [Ectothiorhodospiraceae bacterium]